MLLIEVAQAALIIAVGLALGWDTSARVLLGVAVLLVGTVAFAGVGMLLAGTLRAEANLAVANGLFLVLLFFGGMAYPLDRLPRALEVIARALPAAALAESVRAVVTAADRFPTGSLVVLGLWAVGAPLAAVRWFRWEE